MAHDDTRFDSIFCGAIEIASNEDRAAFVAGACGTDEELRRRVTRLIEAHFQAGSFLESPAGARTEMVAPKATPADGSGTVVGPYKLLQIIGEGGMGTVYMAEQTHPVRRTVALKLIRAGMDSRQVLARFGAERQALALMDHPSIAKVFDAGATVEGRPYFVMELVKGVPITKYCDERRLTLRERLELAIPVCQAVQHAHQKGIIHRDLKPSNVLIALYDGRPVPKIIDFGVAKATGPRLTDQTLYTELGSVVGTLEYMSPEQAELNQLDIDTRSDIYSLGVLLYELLTGSTPLDRTRTKAVAFLEVLRVIREDESPRPSLRLSTTEELPNIAACRHIEPRKLSGLVRGELDWIVMKALEKDRNRRYETAIGLALDIERYLHDEPVDAGPPSASYRLRKLARKHRALLTTAVAFLGLLVLGVLVSTALAVRAGHAESATRQALEKVRDEQSKTGAALAQVRDEQGKTEVALIKATAQEQRAIESAAQSKAVLEFFQEKVLAATRPGGQEGGLSKDVTIRLAVDAAEPQIATAFRDQPAAEAAIRNTMGGTYRFLGETAQAIRQLERCCQLRRDTLGLDHPDTLDSVNNLALAYQSAGRLREALPLFEETFKVRKVKLGPDHTETLITMNNLATAYHDMGRFSDALPLFEQTFKLMKFKLGTDHPQTLASMNNLAMAYRSNGRAGDALPLFDETLKLMKFKLGPDHPDTLASMNNLAMGYADAGRLADAQALYEEALNRKRVKLGGDHPDTLATMNNLAMAHRDAGRLGDALPLLEETLKLKRIKLGADHPDTLLSMNNLAMAYRDVGRLGDALPRLEETLKLRKTKLGPDHPATLLSMNNLAMIYQDVGRLDDAVPLFDETLRLRKVKLGPANGNSLISMNNLAGAFLVGRRWIEAEPLLRECLRLRKRRGPTTGFVT